MSIAQNSIMTWKDFADKALSEMKAVCCNIDSAYDNVPSRLKSTQGKIVVKTLVTGPTGVSGDKSGNSTYTHKWSANPSNLISKVDSNTVNSEWNTFMNKAGIPTTIDATTGKSCRSDKIMQAKEVGLAVGLFMQFMSYHIKPVYIRRDIYVSLDGRQGVYQAAKYMTDTDLGGAVEPKYTLTAIEPGNIPEVVDNDITNLINQGFTPEQLIKRYNNPKNYRCYLSLGA